ncbi:hypothetical protein, partial [Clavibacter phaseoli]|uniref:hypothetical protein n=1 Tax=Clavibacter phaseoli TaxID=1734031 RepID=UPI001C70B7E8
PLPVDGPRMRVHVEGMRPEALDGWADPASSMAPTTVSAEQPSTTAARAAHAPRTPMTAPATRSPGSAMPDHVQRAATSSVSASTAP